MAPRKSLHGDEESQQSSSSEAPTCCMFFPVTYGAVCLSVITLILSSFPVAFGVMLLKNPAYYASVLPELKYSQRLVTTYAGSMLGLGLVIMLFSILAIIGVARRRAGFLMPLLLLGVFSCVLSFFVVLDSVHPTVTHEIYRRYHQRSGLFCFSLMVFLLKLYFTVTMYQSYTTLARQHKASPPTFTPAKGPSYVKVYPIVPSIMDSPPAYA